MMKRIPLLNLRAELDRLRGAEERFGKATTETLESMKQFNLEGATDGRRWKVLSDNFVFEQGELDKVLSAKVEVTQRIAAFQITYSKEIQAQLGQLRQCLPALIATIRVDLGVPEDGPVFREIMSESYRIMDAKLSDMLGKLQENVNMPNQSMQRTV